MNHLKEFIREVPDYPKPGILFYDLTTLLKNPEAFHSLVDELCEHYAGQKVDAVVGIEARGIGKSVNVSPNLLDGLVVHIAGIEFRRQRRAAADPPPRISAYGA